VENAKTLKGDHTDLSSIKQVLCCTLREDPSPRTLETLQDFLKSRHGEVRKLVQDPEPPSPEVQSSAEVDDLLLVSKSAYSLHTIIANHNFLSTHKGGIMSPLRLFDRDWSVPIYVFRNLYWERVTPVPSLPEDMLHFNYVSAT
jgi:hypothetical protein